MQITKYGDNVVEFRHEPGVKSAEFLLISDVHFDNPKCRRDVLKKHLDEAKRRGAKVLINGDFLCIMQGLTDKRHKKGDLRPEHLGTNYFDLVVEEAVEWWAPYADILVWIGYGNHETAVMGKVEHDVLKAFVTLMNHTKGAKIHLGGYGGWLTFKMTSAKSRSYSTLNMFHFHGSGGGGPVTKGVIQDNRLMAMTDGADVIWHGHVHELYHHVNTKAIFNASNNYASWKNVHVIRTSTYKDEYESGSKGWHVERGGTPKPLGGYWMRLDFVRKQVDKVDIQYIEPSFTPCVEYR